MKKKILLILCMFLFITNVNALTFNASITNIEDVGNNNTNGSIENIDLENKSLNILLKAVEDEVSFKVTITNSGDRAGVLKEITVTGGNDKIEYTNNLPAGGLAIDGNGYNQLTITAKLKDDAANGTGESSIRFKYSYDEGSCPDGETLSSDETKCLCPTGKERNTSGICVEPEENITCNDDEVYNENTKTCEKKTVSAPSDENTTPPVENPITGVPSNPKTQDNIILITLLFIVSGLGIYAALFKKLKSFKQRAVVGGVIGFITSSSIFIILIGTFGADKLLGTVINPITKTEELILTVNEEIDLLPVSKQMASEDGAHYLYEGKPFIGTGVGGLIVARDSIGKADYSTGTGVYHRDTRTFTFPDSPAADMAEEYCTGCRLMTKKEVVEWDGYFDSDKRTAYSNYDWWLAEPYDVDRGSVVGYSGYIYETELTSNWVRPAVTISSKAVLTGTGTEEDPYIIDCGSINCSLAYDEEDVPSLDTRERVPFQNISGAYYMYEYEYLTGGSNPNYFIGTGLNNLIITEHNAGWGYFHKETEQDNDISYNFRDSEVHLQAERYCTGCRLMTKEEALAMCPDEGENACEIRSDTMDYDSNIWLTDWREEYYEVWEETYLYVWTISNYDGELFEMDATDWDDAVRPVVSIPSSATMTGSGTDDDPYIIYK